MLGLPTTSAFVSSAHNGVIIWRGNPNCQAAHQAILQWLTAHCTPFLPSPPTGGPNLNVLNGNLGETMTLCVGLWRPQPHSHLVAANAFTPFSGISKPELDILWLWFGATEAEDAAYLQEVKTTTNPALHYANELVTDYDKLFGTDLSLTLHTRLQHIKNKLQYEWRLPSAYVSRVNKLAGISPNTSPKIRLVPTLVHEAQGANPLSRMSAIRGTLIGKGWPSTSVEAHAIGLTDLANRLLRLAVGAP